MEPLQIGQCATTNTQNLGPFGLHAYAVYRIMGSGEDEYYERVSEVFTAVTATTGVGFSDGLNQFGFNCYTDFIDVDDSPLTIRIRWVANG